MPLPKAGRQVPVRAVRSRRSRCGAAAKRFNQILADPVWPALTTTLARAETAGHNARQLLSQAAAERELDTADSPAQVLVWRITAQPNKRVQAARRRSTVSATSFVSAPQPAPTAVREQSADRSQRQARGGPRHGR